MESEIDKNEEVQDGGQVPRTEYSNMIIITNNSQLQKINPNNAAPTNLSMDDVINLINRLKNIIINRTSSGVNTGNITMSDGGSQIVNRPIFYSDLLQLNDPTSEINRIFNAIPIAQFKHLPDPSVLKTPPTNGGQYDLPANPVDETPQTESETTEELPSLEVEEPVSGGASKKHKWSSHKKKRHTRIRTKKNKKL